MEPLEELGDSVLVVGDAATLKIHVHTDDPEAATALFGDAGEVSHLDIADMHVQVLARSDRLRGRRRRAVVELRCGALAVVSGAGLRELYKSLGVSVLDGGPTLNPSTYELLAGIHEVPAQEVVVLPNSPNVVMAAAARRRAVGEGRARQRRALAAGRPERGARARPVALGGGERRRDRRGARADCARARSRRPRAPTARGASRSARPSASSTTRSSRGAIPRRRCARCSTSSPRGPSC